MIVIKPFDRNKIKSMSREEHLVKIKKFREAQERLVKICEEKDISIPEIVM